jgi:hypothetical protein
MILRQSEAFFRQALSPLPLRNRARLRDVWRLREVQEQQVRLLLVERIQELQVREPIRVLIERHLPVRLRACLEGALCDRKGLADAGLRVNDAPFASVR